MSSNSCPSTCALFLILLAQLACSQNPEQEHAARDVAADSVNGEALVAYLQTHFNDLHDVSMRFHHMDHTIGGLIVFETSWQDSTPVSIQVANDETGNTDLANALIEKFYAWRIPGIAGAYQTNLPIRIQLVGSDSPDFSERAIVTGTVTNAAGQPLHRARLTFLPQSSGQESVPDARTNREGVFVRTLIPPGQWTLECTYDGESSIVAEGLVLNAGEHHRETIVIR